MAAFAASAVFDPAMVNALLGDVTWTLDDTVYCMLCANTNPTKTHEHYSQVKAQPDPQIATAGNYTAGGALVDTVAAVLDSNVVECRTATDTAWAAATFSTYGAIVYHGVVDNDNSHLISYHDFGGIQTVTAGTLTLDWSDDGVFKITVTAEA